MNFLAHAFVAARVLPPPHPLPSCTPVFLMGNTLPDLLPLAAPRVRLRLSMLAERFNISDNEHFIAQGVKSHLLTDAAFHRAAAFTQAVAYAKQCIAEAGFTEMRVRSFFLAHVLVEMALDAYLLRTRHELADWFYAHITASNVDDVTRWTQQTTGRELPMLPHVLTRFGQHQYLRHYEADAGVAEGVNRLCVRARQDVFTGRNDTRLLSVTARIVASMRDFAPSLLACETC